MRVEREGPEKKEKGIHTAQSIGVAQPCSAIHTLRWRNSSSMSATKAVRYLSCVSFEVSKASCRASITRLLRRLWSRDADSVEGQQDPGGNDLISAIVVRARNLGTGLLFTPFL